MHFASKLVIFLVALWATVAAAAPIVSRDEADDLLDNLLDTLDFFDTRAVDAEFLSAFHGVSESAENAAQYVENKALTGTDVVNKYHAVEHPSINPDVDIEA